MSERIRSDSSPWSPTNQFHSRKMTDVVVENFKKRRDAGELICNPMSYERYSASKVTPAVTAYDVWTRIKKDRPWTYLTRRFQTLYPLQRKFSPNGYGPNPYASALSYLPIRIPGLSIYGVASDSELAAIHTNLSAKLAAGMTQSLVTMAEMPKTVKMIFDALKVLRSPFLEAKKLLKLTRKAIRDDPNARRQYLDKASNLWMEARFGWRPFIHDVIGHMEALGKDFSIRQYVKGGYPLQEMTREEYHNRTTQWFGTNRVYVIENWSYFGQVHYRLGQTGDMLMDFGNLQHFGALDPLGTAWELVTLSWAVDYFLNVGDVLQSLQAYALLDERVGWTVRSIVGRATVTSNLSQLSYGETSLEKGVVVFDTPMQASESLLGKVRIPVTDFSPQLKSRLDLDWKKVLDLSAVLRNLSKGFHP